MIVYIDIPYCRGHSGSSGWNVSHQGLLDQGSSGKPWDTLRPCTELDPSPATQVTSDVDHDFTGWGPQKDSGVGSLAYGGTRDQSILLVF